MHFFSTLKRSSPNLQALLIRQLRIPQSSAPTSFSSSTSSSSLPVINTCSYDSNPHDNSISEWCLKWISAILLGSSLGLLSWLSTSNSDLESALSSRAFSHAESSNATTESAVDGPASSRTLFRKLSLSESTSSLLFGDAYRRKIFFKYEKRIRLRSPPEKVFEYFASSHTPEGELLMKPADLMRAVVPVFPPSESDLVRDGYLIGERSPGDIHCATSDFFMLFDVNNDGLISFKEYIFFVTLLSIPESSFSAVFKMFDRNNNGEIDKEEFKKVMALMRSHNRQGAQHKNGWRTGLKFNDSVENGGLVEYFFGKDGNGCLGHDRFVRFMRELHDEILRLEFAHYDYKSRSTISAKDFALSIVASADMCHLDKLLGRVDELSNDPSFSNVRITFEEFKSFADLRKKISPFSLALFSFGEVNGLLTKEDFQRAASHVCGISISDSVVNIVFHLFDVNRDGKLSLDEFARVQHKRERDIAQPEEAGILGFLSCFWNCADNVSFSRLHIPRSW